MSLHQVAFVYSSLLRFVCQSCPTPQCDGIICGAMTLIQRKSIKNKWKQSGFEIIIHLHIPIITLRHSMPTYTVFRIKIIQTRKTETKTKSKPNIILRNIFNTQKGIWINLLVASCDLYSCVNGPLTFEVLNQKTIILCGNLPKMAATFPKSV